MGFSAKIKAFFEAKGLNNRDVSKIMDGYSEVMISNYNNSDNWKDNYIKRLLKHFPDMDLNALLKDEEDLQVVSDMRNEHKKESLQIIEDLEAKLKSLKENLSQ
ncbi:hypothetical protein ACI6PS_02345 [Flavobacterium sp. PLA-1-15]|uniref:hypothetical protein n=1 Tax=Flavobacterium sp. PLA-1-15 TaxID=3380533 RepID=UPI003B7B4795